MTPTQVVSGGKNEGKEREECKAGFPRACLSAGLLSTQDFFRKVSGRSYTSK